MTYHDFLNLVFTCNVFDNFRVFFSSLFRTDMCEYFSFPLDLFTSTFDILKKLFALRNHEDVSVIFSCTYSVSGLLL